MSNSFASIDILLLAVIAGVVVYRLYRTFGTQVDIDNTEDTKNVFNKPETQKKQSSQPTQPLYSPKVNTKNTEIDNDEPATVDDRFAELLSHDPDFNEKSFIEGASIAFDMIVNAQAKGDTKTLKPLLSAEVFDDFCAEIKRRRTEQQEFQLEIIGIDDMAIQSVDISSSVVTIVVAIQSEQVFAVYDNERNLIDGHPEDLVDMQDIWHFQRDTKSHNPNWYLVAVEAAEDDAEESEQ